MDSSDYLLHKSDMIDWEYYRLDFASVGRVRCEPGWRLDRNWNATLQDFDLWMVWAGRGRLWIDGVPVTLVPGVCVWARPGTMYEAEQDAEHRLGVSFIHFDILNRSTGERIDHDRLPPSLLQVSSLAYSESVVTRLLAVSQQASVMPDAAADRGLLRSGCRSILLGLVDDVILHEHLRYVAQSNTRGGVSDRQREVVLASCRRIQEEPGGSYRVADLARASGCGRDHYCRLFRRVLGMSPQAYIIESRVGRACQLLRETRMQVQEIADRLGYRDVYFFSRQFKQSTGMAPSAYRKQLAAPRA